MMRSLAPGALALVLMAGSAVIVAPTAAQAQFGIGIGIRVNIAPPFLPVYAQPPIPAPDYLWVPGYWAWDAGVSDYYWVPGTWAQAPQPGYLWTPAYWGWDNGVYIFHDGYWGQNIGFYGGVDYGFGYGGSGYQGGYWQGQHFFYNRSVNNIGNVHITNVYNKTVIAHGGSSRASYNGGPGGVSARATPAELSAARERHVGPTPAQVQHVKLASTNKSLFAASNHGHPPIAATAKPGVFTGAGVTHARGQTPAYNLTASHAGHGPATGRSAAAAPTGAGGHESRGETPAPRTETRHAAPHTPGASPPRTPTETTRAETTRVQTTHATTPSAPVERRAPAEHVDRAPAPRPAPAFHAAPVERPAPRAAAPRPAPPPRAAPAPHEERKDPR